MAPEEAMTAPGSIGGIIRIIEQPDIGLAIELDSNECVLIGMNFPMEILHVFASPSYNHQNATLLVSKTK